MEDSIHVGHPFYFPTQIVLVDDNADFLDGVSLMLDRNMSYRLFQSPTAALDYVNECHKQVSFLQRCYSNYKTGPLDSDSLSHIDIGKLHKEMFNRNRFQTSSTVIVDYSMPEMNGLEFLMALKNPFIKKVLLTGQADTEIAIKAFNKQLIDQFIDKHDPRLKQLLHSTLRSFEDQYFRQSFKLITDPIIANSHDAFLTDGKFQKYFEELCRKTGCAEYYLIESPHSGYLMINASGKRRCLLVYSEAALEEHLDWLDNLGAPAELMQAVRKGEMLPGFDVQDATIDASHAFITAWQNHYQPAVRIGSGKYFYLTNLAEDDLPAQYRGEIMPYADFLESNSLNREILH